MYYLCFEPKLSTLLQSVAGAPHRLQRSADTQSEGNSVNTSSFPYIEVLRGRDEEMDEMGFLVPVGLKGRGETKE